MSVKHLLMNIVAESIFWFIEGLHICQFFAKTVQWYDNTKSWIWDLQYDEKMTRRMIHIRVNISENTCSTKRGTSKSVLGLVRQKESGSQLMP